MITETEVLELKKKAVDIRILTINEIANLGAGHIGGSMSVVDLLTILYYKWLNIDPVNPGKEDRDRVVVSKGHSGPAVYATLADKGYFPLEWLDTLNQGGTKLPSHCDMNKTPGVDFTTGSLGQGSSAAVGIALGNRYKKVDAFTYLVIGDGESQEGQIWEAAMTAAHFKLGKLIAFTDHNKQQLDNYTDEIMSLGELDKKWDSFGWHTQRIDGHDFKALDRAIENAQAETEKPSMIVMDTIKSKGYFPGEGNKANHSMAISKEFAAEAVKRLKGQVK